MSAVRVILASGSPRRRDLLRMVGIDHEVISADIDESYLPGEPPIAHAERLAREKGRVVAERHPEALVLSADTIVVIDGEVLGKPVSEEEAVRMLRRLSGRTHTVFTAVAVTWHGRTDSSVEAVTVTFRPMSDALIRAYVATGEPMDKAGAYGIQGYGATLVERIDGDFFAVMGLAIGGLIELVRQAGAEYGFGPLRQRG
ncbi:MAG TPA: Maf family protein [Gemmatimonadaceae bacterium]|nr:Maf family protein [Gemmatimonadaceae bacterium]